MDPVILVFGGLAAFLIFKLVSTLGETGGEQDGRAVASNDAESLRKALSNGLKKYADNAREDVPQPDQTPEVLDTPAKALSASGQKLQDADPAFDEAAFLDGAKSAYELIVEAFARGDLNSVRRFLGDSVFNAFSSAVESRDEAQQSVDLKFVGIENAALFAANVSDDALTAVTDFSSNQVRVTRDGDGNVIDGDPNRIDLVKDRWTFSRKRGTNDPNWVLVATGAST